MSEIKIALSGHEHEVINDGDTITSDIDVLSLFTDSFMKRYTKFESLIDFVSASGKDFTSQNSWNDIQDGGIDVFIRTNSEFESWIDMYTTAGNEFLKNCLT